MAAHDVKVEGAIRKQFKHKTGFQPGTAFKQGVVQFPQANSSMKMRMSKGKADMLDGLANYFSFRPSQNSQLLDESLVKANP